MLAIRYRSRPRPHYYLAISIMPHCHRYHSFIPFLPVPPIALFVMSLWMKWESAVDSLGVSLMGSSGLDHNKRIRRERRVGLRGALDAVDELM